MSSATPTPINSEQRREIMRRLRMHGEPLHEIGELFGVSRQRVDQILQPVKHKAREKTKEAIATDLLDRPDACERCGRDRDLEAHHHDYGDPLNVEFLCEDCHTEIHGNGQSTPQAYLGRMKDIDPNTFGGRIRQRRLELRMTQRELGDALGCEPPVVSYYETGQRRDPYMSSIRRLADALCCSTDWLIYGDSHPEPEIEAWIEERAASADAG